MVITKSLLNTPADTTTNATILVNGRTVDAHSGEWLIETLKRNATGTSFEKQEGGLTGEGVPPHVCYLTQMGPIESCDTCMVKVDGKLVRACSTPVAASMKVETEGYEVDVAQREAFDRILGNHMLYCTVCDNNNQNCTVHESTKQLDVKHQSRPYREKPYEKDMSNPFYRYDADQCILCGRCVEACQNVQVNETLTIAWESEHPARAVGWRRRRLRGSSCVSCGHCVTVCPCNALMEKSMLGHAGYLTNLPPKVLNDMIEVVKGIEPNTGYGPILRSPRPKPRCATSA